MEINEFENCAPKISIVDFENAEKEIGHKLPVEFRDHYLKNNGGNPENTLFDNSDGGEPFEVVGFYPIKFNTAAYETKDSLLVEHYRSMLDRSVIPDNLLPFAHDPGGNFFCLNLDGGGVVFYATDSFDSDLSAEQNHAVLQTILTISFESFMNQLSRDSSLDSDEWPED
ncbi:SMI1/KNR4 family protein [Burkholderia pyrrocinia]|uniref:SMI1/KNR4 family protein n=1 Tax=Burkholderia pyrrocinia TaxID=60550 RepID=UPI00215A453F|nr:SMI1/KNR4 family protein [Burkholderia pyrrocinia]UVE68933.1 SMI1/KNR4 family protein [Burkholderia pyrrocinia]